MNQQSFRYCIVGAGPAGLSLARVFLQKGIEFDIFERHSDLGGIWDLNNPGSPMYESAHFISSKTQSGYFDYPMPDDYPDYPSNQQILAYHHQFADDFGLRSKIVFNAEVESVEKAGEQWRVSVAGRDPQLYDGVICANGTNWYPNQPQYPGVFSGEVIHAVNYRESSAFKNKRVLVVGAGNSGCDIACDAAANAEQAWISVRRGYYFIPKHVLGEPADVFDQKSSFLPGFITRPISQFLLGRLVGDLSQWGMSKPDHKLYETHPIINDQLVHYLRHGDIQGKPDIERFEGREVVFKDGSRETVDVVVYATGYQWSIPYVDKSFFSWKGGRPDLFLNLFNPDHPTLFALGFMETNGGAYKLFDQMANLIASHILDQQNNPTKAQQFQRLMRTERLDMSDGVKFLATDRNATYVNIKAYRKNMAAIIKRMEWQDLSPGSFDSLKAKPSSGEALEQRVAS